MGRPSKPIISKSSAARAALAVIDEQGIDGLSLQRVAKELGVKAPSLYYHFKNKAELLAEVARRILKDAEVPDLEQYDNWREAQISLALATRASILKHPKAAPLLLQFFPRHLMLAAYNTWTGRFDVPLNQRMVIIEGVEKLTFGSALLGAMSRGAGTPPMPDFDAEQFPDLAASMAADPHSEAEMFEETLRKFLYAF
ncbi:helix-turn-helix transcriptional regulator [Spongiibacter sp. KMU-166]|uniref:Helix-turn-helix transcriptional regulator n=1 Tax=Spongiibacter thalassae TaxID=2721624 RepID=A0ABX1GAH4_9GAMM|nr:helix-turn-helix transcriptional regulator [Spongiibacter thalassae]